MIRWSERPEAPRSRPFQALGEAVENSHGEMDAAFQSDDFREGIAHFLEKRPPAFTGR